MRSVPPRLIWFPRSRLLTCMEPSRVLKVPAGLVVFW
jgi:hypothetical protein